MVFVQEVVQVHRLSDEETSRTEPVSRLQFAVLCHLYIEVRTTFITEYTPPIGQPCHLHAVADGELFSANALALKSIALHLATQSEGVQICLPIRISEELRQQAQRSAACGVRSVNVTPQAFKRSGRYILVQSLPNDPCEKFKVVGCAYLAFHFTLNILSQRQYFRCTLIHGSQLVLQRYRLFADCASPF